MTRPTEYKALIEWMTRRDDALYEQYGKPLEAEHTGEWAAIGPDGAVILGTDDVEVLRQGIERFGSGNFAYRRIGHRTRGRIGFRGTYLGRS